MSYRAAKIKRTASPGDRCSRLAPPGPMTSRGADHGSEALAACCTATDTTAPTPINKQQPEKGDEERFWDPYSQRGEHCLGQVTYLQEHLEKRLHLRYFRTLTPVWLQPCFPARPPSFRKRLHSSETVPLSCSSASPWSPFTGAETAFPARPVKHTHTHTPREDCILEPSPT